MTDEILTTIPPQAQDLSGLKFGRLTVIGFAGHRHFHCGKAHLMWVCECQDGNRTTVDGRNLKSGHTRSCGCLEDENRALRVRLNTKHGDARKGKQAHLYIVWCGMKQRCEDPDYKWFSRWGGRGIKLLWASYEDFKRDMLPTYQPGLEIDRIDNDGPYSKENCRWATDREQALNRRNNVLLDFRGETMHISRWAHRVGLKRQTLEYRIKAGWSIEQALTTKLLSV